MRRPECVGPRTRVPSPRRGQCIDSRAHGASAFLGFDSASLSAAAPQSGKSDAATAGIVRALSLTQLVSNLGRLIWARRPSVLRCPARGRRRNIVQHAQSNKAGAPQLMQLQTARALRRPGD